MRKGTVFASAAFLLVFLCSAVFAAPSCSYTSYTTCITAGCVWCYPTATCGSSACPPCESYAQSTCPTVGCQWCALDTACKLTSFTCTSATPTGGNSGVSKVTGAVSQLCVDLTSLLPIASMLMVVVGAVTYAGGQLMGAETRARANVWATASLTGALMSMLIASVAPSVLSTMYGSTVHC